MSTTQETGRSAEQVLAWSRDVVDPALRAAVATLPGSVRRIASYHFGWQDEHGEPAHADGGKALRPALVLLAAEAVGGPPAAAVPAAVAVELTHNFSLLHDDVMDQDRTRRHRPTAWSVFGVDAAILVGDALLSLALDVIADSPRGTRMLSSAVQQLVDGQIADSEFETRTDVALSECLRMAQLKTGALLGCACALGALLGGAGTTRIDHLRRFGESLGLAYQFVDDLLGIWGDPEVTGKPAHSDLARRKKSLPVVAALTSGTPAGRELASRYRDPAALDLAHAAELIDTAGARTWSQAEADALLAVALRELSAAAPAARSAAELGGLARLATRRDH